MSPLTQAVEDYIQLRRGLGFKLKDYGDYLHKFVAFLQAQGSSHITTRLALANTGSGAIDCGLTD